MSSEIAEFLKRAAERSGFQRDRFEERKIPTGYANVVAMPIFGDLRSMFALSSLVLHRYRQEVRGSKYFVLCSWPGFQGLFPYVDEYWSVADQAQIEKLYGATNGFLNTSDVATTYLRNLNEFFRETVDARHLLPYYNHHLQVEFFRQFKNPKCFLPMVPSVAVLSKEFNSRLIKSSGLRVFIAPTRYFQAWRNGRLKTLPASKNFWLALVKRLLAEGFTPFLWHSAFTHDLSREFTESCFVAETDITHVLAVMRSIGCVLDLFNGTSRLAIAARCPFLAITERACFFQIREYEIDDLCALKLPKQYLFDFTPVMEPGHESEWETGLFPCVVNRLKSFLPNLDREFWPSTGETCEFVSYDVVRKQKIKRFGTHFIKVPRE